MTRSVHPVTSRLYSLLLSGISIAALVAICEPAIALGKSVRKPVGNAPGNTPELSSPSESCRDDNGGMSEWLLRERVVMISGEIEPEMAENVILQLLYLNAQAPTKDIYVYINSPGGEISAGMAIYDVMRSLRADVVTVSLGEASSMATFLLAGGTKGKRLALQNSRIMIHQPLNWGVQGQASDIAIAAKEILYHRGNLNRMLADFTGQSLKRIETDSDRDFFMSAQEARSYGIVDDVVKKLPSASFPMEK